MTIVIKQIRVLVCPCHDVETVMVFCSCVNAFSRCADFFILISFTKTFYVSSSPVLQFSTEMDTLSMAKSFYKL